VASSNTQLDGEAERRFTLDGLDGKIKLLAFASRGQLGDYTMAVALATLTGRPADISLVRQLLEKRLSVNGQLALSGDLGASGGPPR